MGYPVPGGNTGTWPSRLGGSLKNKDNKLCSWVPWDSDLRKPALAMPSINWKVQTRLLVREGAPHQQTRTCLKIIKGRREKIGRGSQMGAWHQDRLADWLSVIIEFWHWLWLGPYFNAVLAVIYRLCGLVVTVFGYRSGGQGSIPGTTKKK
jgi:hypothetical protein